MIAELVAQKFAGSVAALIAGLLTWVAAGTTGIAPLSQLLGFFVFATWLYAHIRYSGMLDASSEPATGLGSSLERKDYDRLRIDLANGRDLSRLYTRVLARALDATDRFFGDAGKPNGMLSKRLFGLSDSFPLWTASSFDTCLVLALVYPIATVFFFWFCSGHVGPAEAALNLKSNFSSFERSAALIAALAQVYAMRKYVVTKSFLWALGAFAVAIGLAITVSVAAAGAIGLAQGAYFGAEVSIFGGVLLGIAWIVAFTLATAITLHDLPAALEASAIAIIFAATMFLNRAISADRRMWKTGYLALLVPGTIIVCFVAAYVLSGLVVWNFIGPLLLFGALMTVLNAPFDWLSLGLTRGLLRRGLAKGGWAPFQLSLLDAILATILIFALVPALVIGVQFFDRIAEHGGGHPILPLKTFFDGIEADPYAAQFWWVYALLLSTMIPSFLNLGVGAFSIIRVFSGISPCLLKHLPAERPVVLYERPWIASCLTIQVVGGALLGLVIQLLFASIILVHIFPSVGLELLHVARWTAGLELPTLIGLRPIS